MLSDAPLKRIDVPTVVMVLEHYSDDALDILALEFERCAKLLRERFEDRRLVPSIRRRARTKLRTARRQLARIQREQQKRIEHGGNG